MSRYSDKITFKTVSNTISTGVQVMEENGKNKFCRKERLITKVIKEVTGRSLKISAIGKGKENIKQLKNYEYEKLHV